MERPLFSFHVLNQNVDPLQGLRIGDPHTKLAVMSDLTIYELASLTHTAARLNARSARTVRVNMTTT